MIGKNEIAESIRNADALVEEHQDLPAFWQERGVDLAGLSYVAEQRGLRAVMMLKGINPNQTKPYPVALSAKERQLLALFAASFVDGFAAAFNLRTDEED